MKNKLLLFLFCVVNSVQAGQITMSVENYPVSSRGPETFFQDLQQQGRKDPHTGNMALGWTVFEWGNNNLTGVNTPQGCLVQKIDINGRVTTYSPFLLNPGSLDWANRFERLSSSVKSHEGKHAQIYISYWNSLAVELAQWENKVDVGADCQQTMQKFTNRINSFNQLVASENANLDRNEGHMTGDNVYRIMGY